VSIPAKLVWSIGFLIGTAFHAFDIWQGGWLPYTFRPLPWNVYWTSLVAFDLLAATLIWVRERGAIVLGCLIMLSNVVVNGYTAFVVGIEAFYFGLLFQVPFTAFVLHCAYRATIEDRT
jgi:hypothetical protein